MSEKYTCIGKGGEYVRIGTAIGAGECRGEIIEVYRDTATGQLYHRESGDFFARMEQLPAQPDHIAQHLNMVSAQSAGDVPEVVGYASQDDLQWQGDCTLRLKPYSDYTIPLMTIAQHARIVAALQARAVVMPERKHTDWRAAAGHETPNHGWNACLDEVARLNAALASIGKEAR